MFISSSVPFVSTAPRMASSPFYQPSFQFENPDCSHQPYLYHGYPQQHRQQQYRYDQPQLHSTACCPPPFKRIRTTDHEHDSHHHCSEEETTTSFYSPLASSCPLLGNTSQEEVEEGFDLESELELLLHELSSNAGSIPASPPFFFSSSSSPSPSPSSSFSSSSDEPAASLPLSFSPPFFTLEAPSSSMSSPSSSGASSPARASFCGPAASAQTAANVRVCLSHKPRGSGGSYVPLAPEQHIRYHQFPPPLSALSCSRC